MATCSVTPKVFLSILTVIFWGCAAGLLYIGVSVYQEFNEYEAISQYLYTLLPATIIIALASFLFVIGLIGCIGAFKEHRCLLAVYCSVLMIILLTSMTGSVLAYVYRDQVETGLMKGLDEALQHYGETNSSSVWTQEIDFMQQELKCCGVNGTSDWLKTPWHEAHPDQKYPTSCCQAGNCTENPATNSTVVYTHGCYSYARQQFMNHLGVVATSAAAFAVILMIGMVCSCILACRRRSTGIPYVGISSNDHMRV